MFENETFLIVLGIVIIFGIISTMVKEINRAKRIEENTEEILIIARELNKKFELIDMIEERIIEKKRPSNSEDLNSDREN